MSVAYGSTWAGQSRRDQSLGSSHFIRLLSGTTLTWSSRPSALIGEGRLTGIAMAVLTLAVACRTRR